MLTLHFAPNSRAVRVAWLFAELDLPYELNAMRFHPEDLKSDAHRQRHPLGVFLCLRMMGSKFGRVVRLLITFLSATKMAG